MDLVTCSANSAERAATMASWEDQVLMKDVLAVVLAGGQGERLEPLTRDRAKPAVPFGGIYRIIDFTLSNCLNSGMRRILVLTQYKAMSLDRHITLGWRHLLCRELGEFIDVVPPQQRIDEQWYQGTADAVYQNIYTLEKERPEYVVILAGDHIYKMDYAKLVAFHQEKNADLTIAAPRACRPRKSRHFGIMQIDALGPDHRLRGEAGRAEDDPRQPGLLPGVDGHLRVQRPVPVRPALPRRDAHRQRPRLRPEHHSVDDGARAACSRFRSSTRTASRTPTGATSARSTRTTRRTSS